MAKSMDAHALEALTGQAITDATSFADDDIGSERAKATEYYRGDPFGDEEEGRSTVVSRDVADTVNAILPSLMRVFTGPENVVEFVPQNQEDVETAEQATDYVNYVFMRDNPGFETLYAAFKDALVRKCGVVKYYWDDTETVSTQEYTGLDGPGLNKLLEDYQSALEAEVIEQSEDENGVSVTLKLTKRADRVRIEALPPEEFLIDRRARSIEDAAFVGHRCMKTVSDLVAMGYDEDEVRAHSQMEIETNEEVLARNPFIGGAGSEAQELVQYVEGYIKADVDGDGIAELVKVCTLGSNYKLIHHEEAQDRPFAAFHCDPEPHTFFGSSAADKVMDVQRIKSALLRNALDSLSLSLNPRMIVFSGDGGVVADAMNPEIGAIMRAKGGEGYRPIVTPDVSGSAYQALTYMDQVKESRTGMNRVSQGLDPKVLQNMTATASAAQFTQSQQHIELIARIFAETGMKRLFRGILQLVVENQRQQRMIQLRNTWTPVDPRGWRVDMDVTTNVALGGGTSQEKLQILAMVAEKQEAILQLMGPENPLVSLSELHNTYSQQLSLAGFKNPDAFFKDPNSPEGQAIMKAQAEKGPPPDPKMVEVQAKAELQANEAQFKQQMAWAEAQARQELDMAKVAAAADLERFKAEISADKSANELDLKAQIAAAELKLKERIAAVELDLKERMMAVEANLKVKKAESTDIGNVQVGGEPG